MFFRINNECLKCHLNAYFDGSKCVCMQLFDGDGFNCNTQAKKKAIAPGSVAAVPSAGINII
jgi:hypothetical protein